MEEPMKPIRLKLLREGATVPTYGSVEAAGADLYACIENAVSVAPNETAWIPTGIALEIPEGYAGLVYARSSLGAKRGLAPANKVGVIDSDYRGEIKVVLYNHSKQEQIVEPNERIAQLVIAPVITPGFQVVDELQDTERSGGGFGSTGK
jgi:dUTP pyrophosphatase